MRALKTATKTPAETLLGCQSRLHRKIKLEKELIKCPRDARMEYYRDHCREIFRNSPLRSWCRQCELFTDNTDADPSPN
jgi:hypothetical protein